MPTQGQNKNTLTARVYSFNPILAAPLFVEKWLVLPVVLPRLTCCFPVPRKLNGPRFLVILWPDSFLQSKMTCLRVNQRQWLVLFARPVWADSTMWGTQKEPCLGNQGSSVPHRALSQSYCGLGPATSPSCP